MNHNWSQILHAIGYLPTTVNTIRGFDMAILHQETMDREEFIRSQGYTITSVWEHDYDRDLREDEEMRQFIEEVAIKHPLNPRDAFKGGRVNAFKLYHQVQENEQIFYYDVTSGELLDKALYSNDL